MEIVEQEVERVLPAFRAVIHCELLKEEEVKMLLQDRKREEAKLVKREAQKDDFINFVARDSIMLKLLQKRRKSINYTHKMAEIEYVFLQRLNRILRRAHRLWPDDENIWKTHINLLEKWNKRTQLSKLYEEYVGKYPHKVAVWMEAARFQLERNGSADQARKILYRAQQNIPNEPVIFDQLFRVELINACILRKRLEITGNLEENEGTDLTDGLAAMKVADIAAKNFPDNGGLLLSMIKVTKSASMNFEKVHAHLVELLMSIESANGIKARAEYYVQYTNGGIELARALYRTELEKSDREDYSEMLFGFAQFTINNKLNDELQHAVEKTLKYISDSMRVPTCFQGGEFLDILLKNEMKTEAFELQKRIVKENANKIEEKAFLARILVYFIKNESPKIILTELLKSDSIKTIRIAEMLSSEWCSSDVDKVEANSRMSWFSSISSAGKIHQIQNVGSKKEKEEMALRYSSCKPIDIDFIKMGKVMFEENEDKQFMFVENCCKNYPKAESYYELLKLAQKKKLSELGNILTRAKGELKEDGEYDKLHQLWQMLKSE